MKKKIKFRIGRIEKGRQIIIISIFIALLFWILESAIHALLFTKGSFIKELIFIRSHELWMRFIIVTTIITFGVRVQSMLNAQKALKAKVELAYEEIKQVFETAADAMRIVDKNFTIIRVNKRFCDLAGMNEEDILNKKCYEIFPGEVCDTPGCSLLRVLSGEERIEYDVEKIANDGRKIPCIVTATAFRGADGEIIGMVEDFKDITERKKDEDRIRESEGRLKNIFTSTPNAIAITDLKGITKECNDRMTELFGFSKEEMVGKNIFDFVDAKDKKRIEADVNKILKDGILRNAEYGMAHKRGNTFWSSVSGAALKDTADRPVNLIITIADINSRKEAERALRESEEKAKAQYKGVPVPTYTWEKTADDFVLIDYNDIAYEITQGKIVEFMGIKLSELYKDRPDIIEDMSKCFKDKAILRKEMKYKFNHDNKERFFVIHYAYAPPRFVLVHAEDITERKRTEEELEKYKNILEKLVDERTAELIRTQNALESAKRLSDIGTLAATVAHELRNPLAVIKAAVYNIEKKTENESIKSHLASIDKKILESDNIIKNFLGYARIQTPQYAKVFPCKILDECLKMHKDRHSDFNVQVNIKDNIGQDAFIEADPLQIEELFSNIINNAYQSFADKKGELKITLDADEKERILKMSFKDNGAGMDQEIVSKVFEPFFTTKARGIGLGLTVVKQIVVLHGGKIDIESKKGQGTTVSISLPMRAGNSPSA